MDAVVSERALREIYLKGFEIAVKQGGANSIMTSYNPVNGHWYFKLRFEHYNSPRRMGLQRYCHDRLVAHHE